MPPADHNSTAETRPRKDLLPIGSLAPDFNATLSDGATLRLSDARNHRRVLLVFYPGDNTPTCTAQLCSFRDDWAHFQAADTMVYGINPAGQAAHTRFAARQNFPFPLLVDAGGKIAGLYGCRGWFGLVRRTVYIIDNRGRVVFAQRGNPSPAALLPILRELQDTGP